MTDLPSKPAALPAFATPSDTDAEYIVLAQERVGVVPRKGQTPEEYADLIARIASSLRGADIVKALRDKEIGVLFVDNKTLERLTKRGLRLVDFTTKDHQEIQA